MSNSIIKLFGLLPNEDVVHSCELTNKKGMCLSIINYGATVSSLKIPLVNGQIADVVLGFDTLKDYAASFSLPGAPYYGSTVGRFAGRINKGKFTLNGQEIQLNINNEQNALHGGIHNFSQKVWEIEEVNEANNPFIKLKLFSPDNEEHFPGDLSVELKYTLSEENEVIIEYKATATEDTIINLTHHGYFNLDGHQHAVSEQELTVNSQKIVELKADNIPTGTILDVSNGSFDFSSPKKCPVKIDNTFVLESKEEFAATLYSKKNHLKMSVFTDQPGVHIYVGGDCGNVLKGKENTNYHALSGICFETQNFPDAPNHKNFPTALLKKGEVYQQKTIYKFETF